MRATSKKPGLLITHRLFHSGIEQKGRRHVALFHATRDVEQGAIMHPARQVRCQKIKILRRSTWIAKGCKEHRMLYAIKSLRQIQAEQR